MTTTSRTPQAVMPRIVAARRVVRDRSALPERLLHIVDRVIPRSISSSERELTRCGKRLLFPQVISYVAFTINDRHCGACGDRAVFDAVWQGWDQYQRDQRLLRDGEEAERQADRGWTILGQQIEAMVEKALEEAVLAGERMILPGAVDHYPGLHREIKRIQGRLDDQRERMETANLDVPEPMVGEVHEWEPPAGDKIGALAVWTVINPPAPPVLYPVDSPAAGKALIDKLATAQLQDPTIFANAFGLIEWDGDEWSEWSSPEGQEIDEWEPSA